jgi:hypothetical protein
MPSRRDENIIRCPFGDRVANKSRARLEVSFVLVLPANSCTQISDVGCPVSLPGFWESARRRSSDQYEINNSIAKIGCPRTRLSGVLFFPRHRSLGERAAGGGFAARRLAGAYQGHILRLSAEGCSFGYLAKRVLKRVRTPVEAKLLEPVYAFDREVLPAGKVANWRPGHQVTPCYSFS